MNHQKKLYRPVHGWVCVDKPAGFTSMQITSRVRHLLQALKAGHAGTLDPFATGILPVALGEATKTIPYLVEARKTYEFTICWGKETDSDDCEGCITHEATKRPSYQDILSQLPSFCGIIEQTPPDYSALHVKGERAYKIARRGEKPNLKPRTLFVENIDILSIEDSDHTSFRLSCGKGVYIRAIARDLGRKLGCYGHLSALRRTQSGCFWEKDAIKLDALQEVVHTAGKEDIILPFTLPLEGIPALRVSIQEATSLRQGKTLFLFGEEGCAIEDRLKAGLKKAELKVGDIALAMTTKEKEKNHHQAVGIIRLQDDGLRAIKIFNA